jgi:hypothetical protein
MVEPSVDLDVSSKRRPQRLSWWCDPLNDNRLQTLGVIRARTGSTFLQLLGYESSGMFGGERKLTKVAMSKMEPSFTSSDKRCSSKPGTSLSSLQYTRCSRHSLRFMVSLWNTLKETDILLGLWSFAGLRIKPD